MDNIAWQTAAWESIKRSAPPQLVADAIFAMETDPRVLAAIYKENES